MKIRISSVNIFLKIFLVILFVAKLVHIPAMVANGMIAFFGIIVFTLVVCKNSSAGRNKILGYTLFMILSMSISAFYNKNAGIIELLWVPAFIGPAVAIKEKKITTKEVGIIYYVICLVFIYLALINADANTVLNGSSRNGISQIVLFYMSIFYYIRYREDKPITYSPAIATLIISLWAQGRTGIFCALLFLGFLFAYEILVVKEKKVRTVFRNLTIILIGTILVIRIGSTYIDLFLTRLNSEGLQSRRFLIWNEYFNSLRTSFTNILFGSSYNNGQWLGFYQNPHNSFIELHSKFGLGGFILVIYRFVVGIKKQIKTKQLLPLILLITLVIRSFFDWNAFPGFYDVMFWLFLL